MKAFHTIVWLSVVSMATPYHLLNEVNSELQINERVELESKSKFKKFIEDDQTKEGIGNAVGSLGGLVAVATMDYDRPAVEVIKDLGDSLIPIIATGLSFIPGGSIIAGALSGIWGLCSPLFGLAAGPSPLERMLQGIKDDIKAIREEMVEMKKEFNKAIKKTVAQIREEVQANLSAITNKALHGEINRNRYICNKYVIVSKDYVGDLRNNRTITEALRAEIVGHIHDCDNFLKDTAEAFVYPEYADLLWIPSAITTMVRVAFLTEIINWGQSLKIDKAILGMFWAELKGDIKRHFEFSAEGVKKRVTVLSEKFRKIGGLTDSEYSSCKIQGQILSFDREIYPNGVPKYFRIFDGATELKIVDFNVTAADDRHHIQVFYNGYRKIISTNSECVFNCITGSGVYSRMPTSEMSFRVTYVLNKSYQIRLLYFAKESSLGNKIDKEATARKLTPVFLGLKTEQIGGGTSNRTVLVGQENDNTIVLTIAPGKPSENSVQRFLLNTSYHELFCVVTAFDEKIANERCNTLINSYSGSFVLENVAAFNVLTDKESKGKIVVKASANSNVVIFGVELIILPLIP